jgi:hypothetical protein
MIAPTYTFAYINWLAMKFFDNNLEELESGLGFISFLLPLTIMIIHTYDLGA